MTKSISLLSILLLTILLLSACSKTQTTLKPASDVMQEILSEVNSTDISVTVNYADDKYKDNFDRLYGLDSGLVCDGSIAYAERGMSADEISILVAKSENDVTKIETALKSRIQQRKNDFNGYAPEEVQKLEGALVEKHGMYVALIICDNTSEVSSALFNSIR